MKLLTGILFTALTIMSCTYKGVKIEDNPTERIIIKESRVIHGNLYYIIKVDSVEFLAAAKGGIVKL